jgi:hypothetical protein
VERDLAALGIIERSIPAIIVNPQETEHAQYQQAVDNDIEGITRRHGKRSQRFAQSLAAAKGK